MFSSGDEDGSGGVLASHDELVAQYQTTRIRALGWAGYKRIFQLTKASVLTLNPDTFSVTNTFRYDGLNNVVIDEKSPDQFVFEYDKTTYTFKTAYREHLLCQLFECIARAVPNKLKVTGPIECERLRKNGTHIDCKLSLTYHGIVESDPYENVIQEYKWVNITRCGTDDASSGFFFEYSGRTKIFLSANIDRLINGCRTHLRFLGRDKVPILLNQPLSTIVKYRLDLYASIPAGVSVFDVNKITKRSPRPMPRQLHISEVFIKETDSSGFQTISFMRVDAIYAIVRSWNSLREFTIEYNDGSSRTYTSTVRDTLLAMLLDVCHATGNVRAIVTGEVSDGLRLMPRFAEEDYKASLKDTFFGASSIEAWFLGRLVKLFKNPTVPINNEEVIKACREFNANVPCPGLTPNTELLTVKSALTGVLMTLQSELLKAFHNDRLDNSRELAIILQTLFRLIPCTHGYKAFVEVKEVDTRQLLLQLLRYDNDFVHYWTLELLMVLCRCPLEPRNMQQEFVNKHTLLTDKTLKYLTELMYYKTEEEEQAELLLEKVEAKSVVEHIENGDSGVASGSVATTASEQQSSDAAAVPTSGPVSSTPVANNDVPASRISRRIVAGNPSPAAHIPVQSFKREPSVDIAVRRISKDASGPVVGSLPGGSGSEGVHFTPNALLVIGAASLLESLLCSRRDTSSPELINQILDLLAERTDVLINMLRSTSFLIMENASILMFSLLKNRPAVAPVLREMALSDCLVLKNFYNAVFSPSASQRYISRFLVATWMSGPERSNPAKALLMRMLPSGLVEYLKFAAITEDHRKNLDAMEDEFYAMFANAGGGKAAIVSASSDLLQSRMRKRIAAALKEKAGPPSPNDPLSQEAATAGTVASSVLTSPVKLGGGGGGGGGGSTSSEAKKLPENYRIMFHVMTQDHKLPDLIWNEQTRLELRTALETEIKEYEREQRLLNHKKIAWNYQQFAVKYESLREELQVGPIYIRYFLEAGEAFLRTLENPNHIVLFEKLFRRVLVNVEHQPHLSILCVRCLTRLYDVCGALIGPFDDMLLMVKLLEQATNLELQQCLLDLLVALSWDERNLSQLLDKHVVNTLMKYVTLAHINPDQIGNALARATAKVLLIQDSSTSSTTTATAGGTIVMDDGSRTDEDIAKQVRRSMWVPEDIACPKVWFAAPPGTLPPPKQVQRGPYRVSELLDAFEHGQIGADWVLAALTTDEGDDIDASDRFDALVDTGRWQTLNGYFQLRLQMLYPGKALYSPAQVAAQALKLLQRLAAIHRSSNSKSLPFYPIPLSKKLMSEPWHLNIFAQLLLSNDAQVVDNAAELLCSLVEFNTSANTKLYLSGAFFFAARYTGNNFFPLARLFHLTHLRQSFHDSAASVAQEWSLVKRSILGMFLPHAMIAVLLNYGPEKFASIFTGEYDTPEVIWNAEARRHLVEMVHQHIGDFPARLRQYTMSTYEYVPMATVHYAALDQEIYVHEYYLRNLCDEIRFPEWPIVDPLALLRECIQRWREEMAKGVVDTSISDAKKTLQLGDRYDNAQLRRAYKNLAREYHPDKNPQGREMFEKIQLAYELLSKVELHATETNLYNVYLLMQTQNILYRRYPERIGDQKYPAYQLIVSVLQVPALREVVRGLDADLLLAGTKLLYYTTAVSPLNAKEFVRTGCVTKLYEILSYAVSLRTVAAPSGGGGGAGGGDTLCRELLTYVMKTFTSIVNVEEGREAVLALCPRFAEDMYDLLLLKKAMPIVVEQGLEVIARCASLPALQRAFIDAGLIWRLVPLLLEYDGTFAGGDYQDESQRVTYNQCAANVLSIVATKALGRLGGYMFDELRSATQEDVKRALAALLTQPLAMLLRNRRPWELLNALNENVETTTKIWNVAMRKELMDFLQRTDGSRAPGSHDDDLVAANDFVFSNLRDELCINGVYVRIFNKTADTNDVLDPSQFCREMLQFVARTLAPSPSSTAVATATATATVEEGHCTTTTAASASSTGPSVTATYATLTAVTRKHIDYTAEALRLLAESKAYIPHDIAQAPQGLETIFLLLELPPEVDAFVAAAKMLSMLFAAEDFIVAFAERTPSITWRLLKCLLTIEHANGLSLWTATEALVANPVGLQALLDAGAIARILGGLLAVRGYVSNYPSRLAALSLLTKMLWNQNKGSDVYTMLCRFLPRPLVTLIRSKAGSASLHVLDTVCENPELIWTAEMQGELRDALVQLLGPVEEARKDPSRGFQHVPVITADYTVPYRQLAQELYLGNVYIRVFLKQPTFRLTNAVFFMEKVTEFWESSFAVQVTPPTGGGGGGGGAATSSTSDSTELILGKEDFLSLLTSCMICVMKGEATIVDHLISWGFVQKMLELMGRALQWERRGSPLLCILRLLHTMILRGDVLDNIAIGRVDMIALLKETLEDSRGGGGHRSAAAAAADGEAEAAGAAAAAVVTLSKDATLVVDLLKRIFQNRECRMVMSYVEAAKRCHLVSFLLDHVLHVETAQLAHVVHPSALKIHAVDCIKAILALDPEYEASLQSFLALHPAWREYRDQSHDLFLTDKEKTDVYLIQDASDAKFAALLLTDGTATKLTNMFPSTGPHADRGSTATSTANHRGSMRTQSKFAPGSASSSAAAAAPAPMPAAHATVDPLDSAPAAPPSATGTATWARTPIAPPAPPLRPVHLDLSLPASQPLPTVTPPVPPGQQPLRPAVPSQPQAPQASQPTPSLPVGSTAAASSSSRPAAVSGPQQITTTVVKGEHGLGLDLTKSRDNMPVITAFKAMPNNVPNPALQCVPPIKVGDIIVGVNGEACGSFADAVKLIRATNGAVTLRLLRSA